VSGRSAAEGHLAGEQLEQGDAEAVLVAGGDGLAAPLLRRHIGRRAHRDADLRQLLARLEAGGEAEVHEHGLAVVAEHDVARLDVAVDDPFLVRVRQRLGQLADDRRGVARREPLRVAADDLVERAAGDEERRADC